MHGVVAQSSGELLLDQQRFQDAVDKFDRAIEIEKAKFVLSMKALRSLSDYRP